jgi:hypothetical protein
MKAAIDERRVGVMKQSLQWAVRAAIGRLDVGRPVTVSLARDVRKSTGRPLRRGLLPEWPAAILSTLVQSAS